jgi:hypothetical protein
MRCGAVASRTIPRMGEQAMRRRGRPQGPTSLTTARAIRRETGAGSRRQPALATDSGDGQTEGCGLDDADQGVRGRVHRRRPNGTLPIATPNTPVVMGGLAP